MEASNKKIVDYSDLEIFPVKPLETSKLKGGKWEFYFTKSNMFSGKDHDNVDQKVERGGLPDMFWGFNKFVFTYPEANFYYEIDPLDMANLSAFERRKECFVKTQEDIPVENIAYYVPTELKVQYASEWAEKKASDKVESIEFKGDWSYSTAYMGTPKELNKSCLSDLASEGSFKLVKATEEIPLSRLGPENPIVDFVELDLFEDELDDNGLVSANFRFRCMKDCFLGLLRNYLRVDNMTVRIIDTRFCHVFGENYMLREFTVKENSYEELKKAGFKFSSEWALSRQQSDIINQHMKTVFNCKDKFVFN